MKICVTATAETLDAAVDPRFGRAQYFVIVDSETMEFEASANPAASASGGAGIQAAQSMVNKGIEVLLTGGIGPNAFPILSGAGIKVITGASGTVASAIEQYKSGALQETAGSTVPAHAGMGGGMGAGRGGGGQGMGRRKQ